MLTSRSIANHHHYPDYQRCHLTVVKRQPTANMSLVVKSLILASLCFTLAAALQIPDQHALVGE